jgi:hypothetical protein
MRKMGRKTEIKRKNKIIGRQENGARIYKRKRQNNEQEIEGKKLNKEKKYTMKREIGEGNEEKRLEEGMRRKQIKSGTE